MTLRPLALSFAVLLLAAGCSDRVSNVGPNYDALPDLVGGDTAKTDPGPGGDNGGVTDTAKTDPGPLPDIPQPDLSTDITVADGTVKSLQLLAESLGCDNNAIGNIADAKSLTGVVVTSPKFDAFTPTTPDPTKELDGYYVADQDGGAWSGIYITIPRSDASAYVVGDVLDLNGDLLEYYCQTQLRVGAGGHTKVGSVAAPTPLELAPQNVGTEAYEGMLLSVKGVSITSVVAAGVYEVTGGFQVAYQFDFFLTMTEGLTYDVVGQLGWSFGTWQLYPRTQADLVVTGGGTSSGITDLQSGASSTDCTASSIQTIQDNLEISGVISVGKYSINATLDGYFLSDGVGGPHSGVNLVVGKTPATDFQIGDHVKAMGRHVEFFCNTQFQAESVVVESSGAAPPHTVLTMTELAASPEDYEGVLVEVADVEVTGIGSLAQYGEADLNGTAILLDDEIIGKGAFADLTVGTQWDLVRGVIGYNFSKYRIWPATAADLITTAGPSDPGPEAAAEVGPEAAAEEGPEPMPEVIEDAGSTDTGAMDAGATDAGATDAGAMDAGATDPGAAG